MSSIGYRDVSASSVSFVRKASRRKDHDDDDHGEQPNAKDFAFRFAMLRDKFGTSWMIINECAPALSA